MLVQIAGIEEPFQLLMQRAMLESKGQLMSKLTLDPLLLIRSFTSQQRSGQTTTTTSWQGP